MNVEQHWDRFIASMQDKRIAYPLLYDALNIFFIIAIVIVVLNTIEYLAITAKTLKPLAAELAKTQADVDNAVEILKVYTKYALVTTIGLLLLIFSVLWTRFMMYQRMLDVKRTKTFFAKFFGVTIVTTALLGLFTFLVQAILFVKFGFSIEQLSSQIWMFVFGAIFLMIVCYVLFNFTFSIFRAGVIIQGTKDFYKEYILGIRNYWLPMLYGTGLFVILNGVMYLLHFTPKLFVLLSSLFLIVYFSWLRIYYLNLLASPKKRVNATKKGQKRKKSRKTR